MSQFSLHKIHAKRLKHLLLFYSYVSMTTTKSKASVSSSGVSRTLHLMRKTRSKRTKHLHPEKRLDASSNEEETEEEDQGTHLTDEEQSDDEDDSFDDDRRKTGKRRRKRMRTDRKGGGGGGSAKIADESELLFPLLLGKKERTLLRSPTMTTTTSGVIKKEKTSIRKHAAENVYQLVACCLQSGDLELAARTTAALLAISRKRMYREEEAEDGGRNEDNEEEEDEDEEANERRRKRKTLSWHHKVERNDWETHKKHERLAMKSCLELMSGGRGGEEEEEEERDAKVIYANLLKEANVGGERHQARFESAFGEFFRAARRKAREARMSTEKAKALRKAKRKKALPHASRFGGYDEEEKEEEEKEEKEDNKLEINLGPEVTEAVRLLEGRGVKMCNFFPKDKKKKLRSSMRLLTDAAMLKVALWFESVKDETVRKHVLRLEMCRSPLTSKEIEMKRRGKSIAKTLDAKAESGAYGDDSLRTSALNSISSLLEARATKNNNSNNNNSNNNERQDINADFSSASSSDDAIKLTIAFAMLALAKNPATWQEPEMTMVTVDEQLRKLVEEFPNDKDAREALATFLIRAYARGYRKDHAERSRKGFAPPKSRPLDCMDAQNIASACLAAVRVDPTCEISTRFLMHCWKYNYKAENVQRVEGIDFLEDAFDDDDEGSINEAGDNFSVMDSASVAYIGSAIDVNELLHVACERVECFPKDEQSWKYLSTALVGVETCTGESDNAHARQYEIIFQNVSTNRAWWPERMFANPKEITFSNIALCKYKAVAACIAFPFDERCKRYVSTFQTFLTKNAKSSPKFSSVRSLLSFLKDSVEVKYERLLTPINKKVSRKRDRVTKSHEGKNRKESEDELKDVEVDDAML